MPIVFVSLPVTDLDRATAFYMAAGMRRNPAFSDHNAVCFVIEEDHSYLMAVLREFFQTFTDLPIGDQAERPVTSLNLFLSSRDEVDAVAAATLAAGGTEPRSASDYGFMYQRGVNDPDGNPLEFGWMDPRAIEQGPAAFAGQQG